MKKCLVLSVIFCLLLFCAPNKTDSKIQTVSIASACLQEMPKRSTQMPDSSSMPSSVQVVVPFDTTGHILYQSNDSLNFTFFISLTCGSQNIFCTSTLLDSETIKVNVNYNDGGTLCDCKYNIDLIVNSKLENLYYIKNFIVDYVSNISGSWWSTSKRPLVRDSLS